MAITYRAIFILLSLLAAPSKFAVQGRSVLTVPSFNTSELAVAEPEESAAEASSSNGTPQYLHAGCAVFLDNSTIFTSDDASIMYRGMTATVINYSSKNVSVPWTFHLSSNPPGYTGIEQAFNIVNSTIANGIVSGFATDPTLTLLPKAANNITIGLLLQANATTFPLPHSFTLNNESCSVVILPNAVPPPANISSPGVQEVQSEAGIGLTTLNGRIIDRTSGEPITLHGFNYFGFDNAQTCVDGLWAGSTALSHDLATIVRTQQVTSICISSFASLPLPDRYDSSSPSPCRRGLSLHTFVWQGQTARAVLHCADKAQSAELQHISMLSSSCMSLSCFHPAASLLPLHLSLAVPLVILHSVQLGCTSLYCSGSHWSFASPWLQPYAGSICSHCMAADSKTDLLLLLLQALGFNAVRLLTSFGSVFGLPPAPQSRSCTAVSAADYETYLTYPAMPVADGATIPELAVRSSHSIPFPSSCSYTSLLPLHLHLLFSVHDMLIPSCVFICCDALFVSLFSCNEHQAKSAGSHKP